MARFFQSEFFFNYTKSWSAIIGSALMFMFVFAVLVGPFLVAQNPYDIASLDLMDSYKPPMWLEGGDPRFPFGTDGQGRDVWASILYGARISLFIGLAAMCASCIIGTFLGLVAGFYGGILDSIIMRIADIQLSFPSILIALFLMSAVGTGIDKVLIALTAVGWVVSPVRCAARPFLRSKKNMCKPRKWRGSPTTKSFANTFCQTF
jgi:peptide/nickel transport system permease protein